MNRLDIYQESYRPQFHFTPATNWLSDPDGLVYYEGEYHLFFQHNPQDNNWGNMTWGHAVSSDLVHWDQLPNAIEPDERGMAFSGSAVVDRNNTAGFKIGSNDTIVILYTAAGDTSPESLGKPYTQCLCFSNDRGRTWERYSGNPVVPHIVGQNRDPKVTWYEPGGYWIMALYLDGDDFGLLTSPDLRNWTRLQVVQIDGSSECPDFFELRCIEDPSAKRWVFTTGNSRYVIGKFDGARFTIEYGPFQLDFGPNFHAAQTFANIPGSDGRRIQMAWMAGGNYPRMPFNQQLTFPCELTLHQTDKGLRLYRYPIAELGLIRDEGIHSEDQQIDDHYTPIASPASVLLDISAEIEFGSADRVELCVHSIVIDCSRDRIAVDAQDCSVPLSSSGNRIVLRILLDRTSVEIFVNNGAAVITFCYLPKLDLPELSIRTLGGTARLIAADIYTLHSAWLPFSHT